MKFSEVIKEFVEQNIQYTSQEIRKMLVNQIGADVSVLEIAELKNTILLNKLNSIPLPKGKRMFQILDDMNLQDVEKKTSMVEIATTFLSGSKVKHGAQITMGAPESTLHDIMNDDKIPILILVHKNEYFKRKKESLECTPERPTRPSTIPYDLRKDKK